MLLAKNVNDAFEFSQVIHKILLVFFISGHGVGLYGTLYNAKKHSKCIKTHCWQDMKIDATDLNYFTLSVTIHC